MTTKESPVSLGEIGNRLAIAEPLASCAAQLAEAANGFLTQKNYALASATMKIVNELMEIANANLAGESITSDWE
jgi:hypothetical protein